MWLLILEALAALALLGGAVWWTMFSGRRRDPEPEPEPEGVEDPSGPSPDDKPPDDGPPAR